MEAKMAALESSLLEQRDELQAEVARRGQQLLALQEADASRQDAWHREREVSTTWGGLCGVWRTTDRTMDP